MDIELFEQNLGFSRITAFHDLTKARVGCELQRVRLGLGNRRPLELNRKFHRDEKAQPRPDIGETGLGAGARIEVGVRA